MQVVPVVANARIPSLDIGKMLEEIRESHIDIIPIVQKELETFLPAYIEEIVRNTYGELTGVEL